VVRLNDRIVFEILYSERHQLVWQLFGKFVGKNENYKSKKKKSTLVLNYVFNYIFNPVCLPKND